MGEPAGPSRGQASWASKVNIRERALEGGHHGAGQQDAGQQGGPSRATEASLAMKAVEASWATQNK